MLLKEYEGNIDALLCGTKGNYKATKLLELIEEFRGTDLEVMEITNWENNYKKAMYVASGVNAAAKRFGYHDIKAFTVHERVFIRKVKCCGEKKNSN